MNAKERLEERCKMCVVGGLFGIIVSVGIICITKIVDYNRPIPPVEVIEVIEEVTPSVNVGDVWVLPNDNPFKTEVYEVRVKEIRGDYLQTELTSDANVLISHRIDYFVDGWEKVKEKK
jgi:hypothetical protein